MIKRQHASSQDARRATWPHRPNSTEPLVKFRDDEFYQEVITHPIPTDLEAVKALAAASAVLDLFMWLTYRRFVAKGPETIPIFGPYRLAMQIGSVEYLR